MFSLVATKQISGSRYLRIIGISNDGKFIATNNRDSVEIYDVKSWRIIHTLNVAGVFQASFSKSYVSTTSRDNFVRIYNLTNGEMEIKKQWKQELKEMEEKLIQTPHCASTDPIIIGTVFVISQRPATTNVCSSLIFNLEKK